MDRSDTSWFFRIGKGICIARKTVGINETGGVRFPIDKPAEHKIHSTSVWAQENGDSIRTQSAIDINARIS